MIENDGNAEVIFRFRTDNASSDALTRSGDKDSTETGTAEECLVNSVILYFYDAETKSFSSRNKISGLTKDVNQGYISKKISIKPGVYDIFAVCNTSKAISAATEDELLGNIDADTYSHGIIDYQGEGFVMTNRAESNLGRIISGKNGMDTIEIAVERCVSRLEVAKVADSFELKDEGETYAELNISGYYFINLPTSFYSFRHVAELTGLTEPTWSIETNFGETRGENGYVIDPYFFKKTVSAAGFSNPDGFYTHHLSSAKTDTTFRNLTLKYEDNKFYALENCALKDAQKHAYSSGILFKGVITPADNVYDVDNVGTLSKVEATSYSKLYFINYKFYGSIDALIKTGVKVTAGMTEDQLLAAGVKTFNGANGKFDCYYKYWIRHIDNNDPTKMGVMEFGIVRNNIYRMKVTGVSGLGDGDIHDDPDEPDENETGIKVSFNVKHWIVRNNTNIVL